MKRADESLANDADAIEFAMGVLERGTDPETMAKIHRAMESGVKWIRLGLTLEAPVDSPATPPYMVAIGNGGSFNADKYSIINIRDDQISDFQRHAVSGFTVKRPAPVAGGSSTDSDTAVRLAMDLLEREVEPELMVRIHQAIKDGAIWVRDMMLLRAVNEFHIIFYLAEERFIIGYE